MSSAYFIIAGPQAAGKSTISYYLSCKFQSLVSPQNAHDYGGKIPNHAPNGCQGIPTNPVVFQEMRQIVLRERFVPGGIFMDWAGESEIIDRDLERLDNVISKDDKRIYIDETNVFTLAHAGNHNIDTKQCMEEYLQRLSVMNPLVVFLDIKKDTSWARRKHRYEERVADFPYEDKSRALRNYRDYLNTVYDKLYGLYDDLTLPKVMISTEKPLEDALTDVSSKVHGLARDMGITLIARI